MADSNNKKVIAVPTKPGELSKEQIDYFKGISEKIVNEFLLDLDYGKRKWRDEGYQGGKNGLTDDKDKKKGSQDDIKAAQEIFNKLMAANIPPQFRLSGPALKESGIYDLATKRKVMEFQKKINDYLKKNGIGLWVNPSEKDKSIANALAKKYDLYSKDYVKAKIGNVSYEIDMQDKSATGRKGLITMRDKNGKLLGKMQISVTKDGKVTVNSTYIMKLLEDGYLGEETRKAILMLCNELTQTKVVAKPVENAQIVPVGYSFKGYLSQSVSENENILVSQKSSSSKAENRTLLKIKDWMMALSYNDEIRLRNGGQVLIEGESYAPTFEGLKMALSKGVESDDIYSAFLSHMKKVGIDASAYKKVVEKGRVESNDMFVMVGAPSRNFGGKGVVLDFSGIDAVFADAIRNLEALPKGQSREELISGVNQLRKVALGIMREVEIEANKKNATPEQLLKMLNERQELTLIVDRVGVAYGNALGTSNYLNSQLVRIENPSNFDKALQQLASEQWESITKQGGLCEKLGLNQPLSALDFVRAFKKEYMAGPDFVVLPTKLHGQSLSGNKEAMALFLAAYSRYSSVNDEVFAMLKQEKVAKTELGKEKALVKN